MICSGCTHGRSTRCRVRSMVKTAPKQMDVHLASCVPMRISSQCLRDRDHEPLRCVRFQTPSCTPNIRILARPNGQMQRYHRDSTPRLSCNLGRDVTSSFCGSLFSAGVRQDPNAFRPLSRSASLAVVCSPTFDKKWLSTPSRRSRFTKTFVQYSGTCVLPHTDCSATESGAPCRPSVGALLHIAPMSEFPLDIDRAAYRLLSKRRPFQIQHNCTTKMIAKFH